MSGTRIGARKAVETIKNRYGVDSEGKSIQHMKAGAIGGKHCLTGGFYYWAKKDPEYHKSISRRGGKVQGSRVRAT